MMGSEKSRKSRKSGMKRKDKKNGKRTGLGGSFSLA